MTPEIWAALIGGAAALAGGILAMVRYRHKTEAETDQIEADAGLKRAESLKAHAEAESVALKTAKEALEAWRETVQRMRVLEDAHHERDKQLALVASKLSDCEGRERMHLDQIAPLKAKLDQLTKRVRELESVGRLLE